MKCTFYLEIQHSEDQRIQFEDVKKQLEDFKAIYEDTKAELKDTKQLEDSKNEILKIEYKFAKIGKYIKDCNEQTFCQDGKSVGCRPGNRTKILALKNVFFIKYYCGSVKVLADDTGVVHTGNHFYLEMISLDSFISVIDDKSRSSIRDLSLIHI